MKLSRYRLPLVALAVGVLVVHAPRAWSFHDDGVADCKGCHIMHESEGGMKVAAGGKLLRVDNPSDLCLQCHGPSGQGYSVMSQDVLNPLKHGKGAGGGDFVFLLEDNLNDGPSGFANPIPGERAGHSIVAPTHGLNADATLTTAPGGSYPSDKLTCTSCHDPHGGPQFRFLYGSNVKKGATSRSLGYTFTYSAPAPVAEEMPVTATESDTNHNAYKSGISDWCEVCHGNRIHDEHRTGFEHPGEHSLGGGRADNYNHYNGTLNPVNPSLTNPYLALVPLQWNSTSNTSTFTGHIDGNARVMCLSCHRAHASSGPKSGRWDFTIETWASEGSSGSYPIENPYAASSGDQQRRLCEKCHGLGEPD